MNRLGAEIAEARRGSPKMRLTVVERLDHRLKRHGDGRMKGTNKEV